jgi:hypothetical protein
LFIIYICSYFSVLSFKPVISNTFVLSLEHFRAKSLTHYGNNNFTIVLNAPSGLFGGRYFIVTTVFFFSTFSLSFLKLLHFAVIKKSHVSRFSFHRLRCNHRHRHHHRNFVFSIPFYLRCCYS